jgi:SAM-dependent methyltransferase
MDLMRCKSDNYNIDGFMKSNVQKPPIPTRDIACNLCGNSGGVPLFSAVDRLHGFGGQFQYVTCTQCGLVYMNPQISADHIGQVYPPDYTPHQYGSEKPEGPLKLNLPKPVQDILCARSVILDVGCGNGSFLSRLRKEFQCVVHGVDISLTAIEVAKKKYGLDLFCGQIAEAPYAHNAFDLITAWSCIEHVPDPVEVVRKTWSLCKPGGWFVVKTPNSASFPAKLFGDKWYHLDCPRHLFLFNPKTIRFLLEQCGFIHVQVDFEASSKGWLGSLQYAVYGDNWRQESMNRIRRSKMIKAIVSPIPRIERWLRRSDTLVVFAQKPV